MAHLDHDKQQNFVLATVRISPVFRLHSDILRKFNPEIKGMSMGQGRNQSGLNMAVSGAKIE